MKVEDFMTKEVVTCTAEQTVEEAAQLMAKHKFSVLPIVDASGDLVGIITESDFVGKELNVPHALASIKQLFGQTFYFQDVEKIYSETKMKKLSAIMTKKVHSTTPEASLTDVVNFMISKNLKRLPVVVNKKIVGMITRKDLINAFIKAK